MTDLLHMSPDSVWLPLLIFAARVTDVSIGTVRIIMVTRGQRLLAVVLAFFEILVWVAAVTTVLAHLDNWLNILGFAAGFATGNAVGMAIERRLAMGLQTLTFLSRTRYHVVAERLRFSDLEVTAFDANGRDGGVAMCVTVVPRKIAKTVIAMAREVDPDVRVTVEDVCESTLLQPCVPLPGKTPGTIAAVIKLAGRNVLKTGPVHPCSTAVQWSDAVPEQADNGVVSATTWPEVPGREAAD